MSPSVAYKMSILKNKLYAQYLHVRQGALHRQLIEGRRILVCGSGPTAADLHVIPADMVCMTCNAGLKLFDRDGMRDRVDVYICAERKLERKGVLPIFDRVKIKYYMSAKIRDLRRHESIVRATGKFLIYDGLGNYYKDRLFSDQTFRSKHPLSTAVKLVEYALYYKPKSIHLSGIDLNNEGYYWGGVNQQKHIVSDREFLLAASSKFKNIFVTSEKSPLIPSIPYCPL